MRRGRLPRRLLRLRSVRGATPSHADVLRLPQCLCCPDPCYEPRWDCTANAALFTPVARPATYSRLRWDAGRNLTQPDRAEYYWAAIGGSGPANPESRVNYNELSLYAEMGGGRFSFFINTPYRNQEGDVNGGSGGFGDLTLGTKTMLVDSELMQITFALGTTIPVGLSGQGAWRRPREHGPVAHLGRSSSIPEPGGRGRSATGSRSAVRRASRAACSSTTTRSTTMIARPLKDTALIGTIESSGWTFTAGSVTEANGVVQFGQRHHLLQRRPRLAAVHLRQARLRLRRAVRHHQRALRRAPVPHRNPLAILIPLSLVSPPNPRGLARVWALCGRFQNGFASFQRFCPSFGSVSAEIRVVCGGFTHSQRVFLVGRRVFDSSVPTPRIGKTPSSPGNPVVFAFRTTTQRP